MKKRFAVTVAVIGAGCAIVLSGCGGCAGCGQSTKNVASLSSNWYANTAYKKIQPTFTEGSELFQKEDLEYKVTCEQSANKNEHYSVEYAEGTYTTEFYASSFDKEVYCLETYKGSFPETLTAYYYKTQLSIPEVTFTVGSESKTFEGDSQITECWFLPVENRLQPLYSKITVKSVTPATNAPKNLAEAVKENNYEYTTYYDYEGTVAKTTVKDGSSSVEKPAVNVKDVQNTVFDVASLNVAVRASIKSGESLSQVVSLYSPASGIASYGFTTSSATLKDGEKSDILTLLKDSSLYKAQYDSEGKEKGLETSAVNVIYGGQLTGVSQTYFFTAIGNPRNNTGRATMVKLVTPLAYDLGSLNYTLTKVNQTLYTGEK